MKHLFIPYELALLAKEKGFNEDCLTIYKKDKTLMFSDDWACGVNNNYLTKDFMSCLAPLYQQLVDWFLSKDILISILYIDDVICFHSEITHMTTNTIIGNGYNSVNYYTAFNSAIKEAFKLI